MTTARDIAERLNLSVSTVGRALADDRRISDQTKLRVKQTADELGYVANRAARMMRGVSSTVVGLVVPDVRNSFYATVAHALTETMRARDHQVMLCETGDDRQTELRQVKDLTAAQVAGVVIVPTPRPHPDVRRMLDGIPHAQLNRRVPALSAPWFGIDDRSVTHAATDHLIKLGHRRIGYIGGTVDIPTAAERLAGFEDAIAEAGLDPECGIPELGPPSQPLHGSEALGRLMAAGTSPTAIVTSSVQMTVGVLSALHDGGYSIPEDLSIVGFGDEPGFSWWGPGLTTMALPVHELASACGVWLLHQLEVSPAATPSPYASAFPGQLVIRGSTGAPPRRAR